MTPLDSEFWANERRRLLAILKPKLTELAAGGIATAGAKLGIVFDNELANKMAAQWASRYTDDLLRLVGTTDKRVVGETLSEWIGKPGATMADLNAALEGKFGAGRANTIAVTETTRAYAQGERMAYESEGIQEWTWRTNRDDLVCKICGPLNGKTVRINEPFGPGIYQPPAHPNCRCWVTPKAKKTDRNAPKPAGYPAGAELAPAASVPLQKVAPVAKQAAAVHTQGGGGTFNLRLGNMAGTENYSVSIYPELSRKFAGKEIAEKDIKQFIIDNLDLLSDPRVSIGTWYNPDDHMTYLDASVTLENEDVAKQYATEYNQIGMFDLKKSEYIETGGSGLIVSNKPFRMNRLPPLP